MSLMWAYLAMMLAQQSPMSGMFVTQCHIHGLNVSMSAELCVPKEFYLDLYYFGKGFMSVTNTVFLLTG